MTDGTHRGGENSHVNSNPRVSETNSLQTVTVLTNILSPYRIPLFEALAQTGSFDLSVVCLTDSQRNREWRSNTDEVAFESTVLSGYSMHSYRLDRSIGINPSVITYLRHHDPDVLVVGGYSDMTSWVALSYAKLTGVPLVLWTGSWEQSARLSNPVTDTLKRLFIRQASTWVTYGSRAEDMVVTYGADRDRVYQATNTVDTEWFREQSQHTGTPPESGGPLELLYCGQLIPRKNLTVVFDAIDAMSPEEVRFTIVGDGPARSELADCAKTVTPEVRFEGYIDRDELPRYYASADALVLPSKREVWGLVVNEALACGTAAIVSERCGCASDLIDPGFNGFCFDPTDSESLRCAIDRLIEQKEQFRRRRPEIAQDIGDRASIQRAATQFASAIREAYIEG